MFVAQTSWSGQKHGRTNAGVSNPVPGGPMPCKVLLQYQLNTPEPANQCLNGQTGNLQAGVLR